MAPEPRVPHICCPSRPLRGPATPNPAPAGSKLEGPGMQIVKVKGSSPAVQLDAAQRRQTVSAVCLLVMDVLHVGGSPHGWLRPAQVPGQ